MSTKQKGFTLLELLIVIAIIGILISAGIVSYGSAQKKSRDSKRRADLKSIQNGFEQYYADKEEYPAACNDIETDMTYLPGGIPTDPKPGWTYSNSCDVTQYCFCTQLEAGAYNSGANCNYQADPKTLYCVSSLQ